MLEPFSLTEASAFALTQISFVNFVAPLATLSIMDKRGVSGRQMTATLVMVFTTRQDDVFYPLAPFGLHWLASVVILVVDGLYAAAVAWYVTGRHLLVAENPRMEALPNTEQNNQGVPAVISSAGSNAIRLALDTIPMSVLSLIIVGLL